MAKERAVVVGAGAIAHAWLKPLIEEGVQVLAVVDRDLERARRRVAEFVPRAEASAELEATLRRHRPDFVVDLTSPEAHAEVTVASLKAGCHVLGEKPMATSLAEARKMVQAAEKARRTYMVSQTRRWDLRHDAIRRTIASGRLGAVTTLNCDFYIGAHFGGFRDKMPSPLILDMAVHHFDLARFFSGCDAASVYCREFNPRGSWYKGAAAASCIFEMTNGVVFNYRGSWCAEGCHTSWNGDWRIVGEKGTLLYDHDRSPVGEVLAGDEGFHRPKKELILNKSPLRHPGMRGAIREMLACLRKGTLPQTHSHDNIRSLAMVFAAIESSQKGKKIPVKAL
ncbi:MAG: putative oxidoreductase YteT precursor [Planctomycetes bacterium ADurb.Bin126]|nr:MAG: putative oxidoreductase YteT precursor [Planctomycetes bacterium ADurb.Bin126]